MEKARQPNPSRTKNKKTKKKYIGFINEFHSSKREENILKHSITMKGTRSFVAADDNG
jgi:hypothetical protein